jgi:hypothetical protein
MKKAFAAAEFLAGGQCLVQGAGDVEAPSVGGVAPWGATLPLAQRSLALARDVASWWCASWQQRLVVGCTVELHLHAGRSSSGRAVADSDRSRPCGGYPQGALSCEGFHSTSRPVEARVSGQQLARGRPGMGDTAGFASEGELRWWCLAAEVKFRQLGTGVERRHHLGGVALAAVSACYAGHMLRRLVFSGRKPSPASVWWSDDC